MRKIKEATGVSDVNEVIQKYLSQEDTHNNLVDMTNEAQTKIETLNKKKLELKSQVEEIKYSGSGSLGSRRIIDEFEHHLSDKSAEFIRERQKFERVAKILTNVKSGIEHLYETLEIVNAGNSNEENTKIKVTDETVVDVLALCEQKLLKVMETITPSEGSLDEESLKESIESLSKSLKGPLIQNEANIRVKLESKFFFFKIYFKIFI